MDNPISIKSSNKEGEIELHRKEDKLAGNFTVTLNSTVSPNGWILYRLRVKDLAIVFSKTYGLLFKLSDMGEQATVNTYVDDIFIYADLNLSSSVHLSTIRVEYIDIASSEAERLLESGVERSTCRPYFLQGKHSAYDVKCVVKGASSIDRFDMEVFRTWSVAAALAVLALFAVRKLSSYECSLNLFRKSVATS